MRRPLQFRLESLALSAGVVLAAFLLFGADAPYGTDVPPKSRWASGSLSDYGVDSIPGVSFAGRIEPSYGLDVPPNIQHFPTPQDAYYVWSGGVHQTHARDEARLLKWYSMAEDVPAPIAAQEHAANIRSDLEAARKDYSGLSKKMRSDKTASKHSESIESHLTKAIAACDQLDAECTKGKCNPKSLGSCCSNLDRELDAANAEHRKLLQHYAPKTKQEADGKPVEPHAAAAQGK